MIMLSFTNCSSKKAQFSGDAQKLPKLTLFNHSKIMNDLLGEPKIDVKNIGILVYDGCHAMEALGAMSVFSEMMNVKIHYIAPAQGIIKTDVVGIFAEKTIDNFESLDLLIVPGGNQAGMEQMLRDQAVQSWIRKIDPTTKLTAGIGYGSLILGRSGVLKGKRIAADWYKGQENALKIGAAGVQQRYVNDGKYWTSVGQTAVLDMTLAMLDAIAGEKNVQGAMLDLEYDPQPPMDAGTKLLTPENVLGVARENAYAADGFELLNDTPSEGNLSSGLFQAKKKAPKNIGIVVYDGFFTLDAIGPLVVLSQMPNVKVTLLAKEKGKLKTGRTYLNIERTLQETKGLDMVVIPGGAVSTFEASQDPELLSWLKDIDKQSQYTVSVCTGSWILGAAGLLKGKQATSHWYMANERLSFYGAHYKKARYTNDGKYWTSAGVSAGIDVSYALMREIYGDNLPYYSMLQLDYHPEPPVQGGTPEKTHPLVTDMMVQMYDYGMLPLFKQEKKKAKAKGKAKVEVMDHSQH